MLEVVLFYAYRTARCIYEGVRICLSCSYTSMLEAALIGDEWVPITR